MKEKKTCPPLHKYIFFLHKYSQHSEQMISGDTLVHRHYFFYGTRDTDIGTRDTDIGTRDTDLGTRCACLMCVSCSSLVCNMDSNSCAEP